MGNMHIVTGYKGQNHVTAADVGSFNAAIFGTGSYVLNRGDKLEATVVSNTMIHIADGDILMQGRHVRLNPGSYVELNISNGSQGYKRNDLIVARYTKDSVTGVEDVNIVVIKGTAKSSNPSDPPYTAGDIIGGNALLADMPLYRVQIDGINISALVPLFEVNELGLADGSVTAEKLHKDAVTTEKVKDLSITSGKIANTAVTEGKIANNAVSYGKLASGLVLGYDQIMDASSVANKLASAEAIKTAHATSNVTFTAEANSGFSIIRQHCMKFGKILMVSLVCSFTKTSSDAVTAAKLPSSLKPLMQVEGRTVSSSGTQINWTFETDGSLVINAAEAVSNVNFRINVCIPV